MRGADQRPAIQIRKRGAGPQCSEAIGELFEQRLVERRLDEQPRARAARLPGVLHDRVHDDRQRGVDVGVRENDLRPLAAELQRNRAVSLRARLRHDRPGRGRAGERQVRDAAMRGERRPGLRAEPGHEVQCAGGQAGVGGELRHAQQRKTRVLGRLDHARVARRQRRADRAAEDLQRIVPRNDVTGDAVRLAPRQHRVVVRRRGSSRRAACPARRRRTRNSARTPRRPRAPASTACRNRALRSAQARRRAQQSMRTSERARDPSPPARDVPTRPRRPTARPARPHRRRPRCRGRSSRTARRRTDRSPGSSCRSPGHERPSMKCWGGVTIDGQPVCGAFMRMTNLALSRQ